VEAPAKPSAIKRAKKKKNKKSAAYNPMPGFALDLINNTIDLVQPNSAHGAAAAATTTQVPLALPSLGACEKLASLPLVMRRLLDRHHTSLLQECERLYRTAMSARDFSDVLMGTPTMRYVEALTVRYARIARALPYVLWVGDDSPIAALKLQRRAFGVTAMLNLFVLGALTRQHCDTLIRLHFDDANANSHHYSTVDHVAAFSHSPMEHSANLLFHSLAEEYDNAGGAHTLITPLRRLHAMLAANARQVHEEATLLVYLADVLQYRGEQVLALMRRKCAHCGTPQVSSASHVIQCSCRLVCYCTKACQRAHAAQHTFEHSVTEENRKSGHVVESDVTAAAAAAAAASTE
jgi:hypothetical protein